MAFVTPGTSDQLARSVSPPDLSLRDRIRSAYYLPEVDAMTSLIDEARLGAKDRAAIHSSAKKLILAVRARRKRSAGLDTLMNEFSLSSSEGVALMRLAEAVLRVPDKPTLDRLIRDKVGSADWSAHIGRGAPWFVNATAWGLMLTGRVTQNRRGEFEDGVLARLVARGGEPIIRKGVEFAVRLLAEKFVAASSIEDALWRAQDSGRPYRQSFDMLGESAINEEQVRRHLTEYVRAIHAVGTADQRRGPYLGNGVSVKLSALHPRYEDAHRDRVVSALLPRVRTLASLARRYDIGFNIDAEDCDSLDLSIDVLEALAFDPDLAGWNGLGCVVQAYQKRARPLVDYLIELARASGHRLMVRLVKGAYWDSEIKRAQAMGLPEYPVFTRKAHTDVSYLACARALLDARDAVFPQFATHNALTAAAIHRLAGPDFSPGDWEFQCLYGMGETLYDEILDKAGWRRPVRVYCPVGGHATLLPYLVRRILENGANSSFVSQLVDAQYPLDKLLADPAEAALAGGLEGHPGIELPAGIYGAERINSAGADLALRAAREPLEAAIAQSRGMRGNVGPIVGYEPAAAISGERWMVLNPADFDDELGVVQESSAAAIDAAVKVADEQGAAWSGLSMSERAAVLDAVAQAIERERDALVALCVREAGKTLVNALGEVREAVDFCRYYAARARELPADSRPLGRVVCISPWNFPLAIFVGQVAAALVTGNRVLAKPAEQTTLTAACVTRLMHQAGVPLAALQLLPGRGETVGARLVSDPGVEGVMFTGSIEVAREIDRALATRAQRVPLIAETGGINAMIVDSTALPHQVVADVLVSAFDSAGQRCSSLRVLCLQHDIADEVLGMLRGAMRERVLGEGENRATDIGPVIDPIAQARIVSYLEQMRAAGHDVGCMSLSADCARGCFVPPTLVEIERLDQLEGEVFGPVLHVLRYEAQAQDKLVEALNALGYGLTLGIHSRIDETVDAIVAQAKVGNIYVNRNMVGAVVGSQPFGGEGLSGTGPKAGGPLYLLRLLRGAAAPDPLLCAPLAPPAFEALVAWLAEQRVIPANEADELAAQAAIYRARVLVGQRVSLPGVTGEDNTLGFHPRSPVFLMSERPAGLVHQLLAMLSADGCGVVPDAEFARECLAALPPLVAARVECVADWQRAAFSVVLHDGAPDQVRSVRAVLAAREGPIVAVLSPQPIYDTTCLVIERCVTVNTAAAGGNIALASLPDS